MSESETLQIVLDEGNNVVMVLAPRGASLDTARKMHASATLVAEANEDGLWRAHLVEDTSGLSPEQLALIWPDDDQSPTVVLSLGTGLARQRKGFQLTDHEAYAEIRYAYAHDFSGDGQ